MSLQQALKSIGQKNKWFDFGLYKGGNTIDFCLEYYQCTIPELIEKNSINSSFQQRPQLRNKLLDAQVIAENKIVINKEEPLHAYSLKKYLLERLIPTSLAEKYCCQLSYQMNGKNLYGIGFKNDSGGYELRSPILKNSSTPKDITTINNGAEKAEVFEGFTDFLSYHVPI